MDLSNYRAGQQWTKHDHDGERVGRGRNLCGGTSPHLFVTVLNLLMAAEWARI
jgi:hypothetical protein